MADFSASDLSRDTPVVARGGKVAVVNPEGLPATIDESDLPEAMRLGYKLEAPAEAHGRAVEQRAAEQPLTAGIEGVARGATFGLSDVGLQAFGSDPEMIAARAAQNPLAAGAGQALGTVAGLGLTGLGSAAGAAGEAAFSGTGLLSRVGASAVRTGLEGAAIGAGQGISDVALAKDPMSAEAIVGQISHRVLVGAGLGAAVGAAGTLAGAGLGAAIGKAGQVARKVATKMQDELVEDSGGALAEAEPALRSEVMAMDKPALEAAAKAEQTAVDTTRAQQGTALAQDIRQFDLETRNQLFAWRQQLPDKGLIGRAIKPSKALGNIVDDPKTLAEQPGLALGPLRRMEVQVQQLGEVLPDADNQVKPILDRMRSLQDRIADATGDATSPRLDAINARLEQLSAGPKATPHLDAMAAAAGGAVGGALGHASGIPGAGLAGAWLGKELGATMRPLLRKVLGAYVDHAGAIADGAESFASKLSAPSPAMNALKDLAAASTVEGSDAYDKATKAITQAAANPQQTEGHLREQMAGLAQAAPQLAAQVVQGLLAKVQFLASKIPPPVPTGINGVVLSPSDMAQATFARYVAAANDPMRLMRELRAGMLMPETVETHQALFPATVAKIQESLTEQIADPRIAAKMPYAMRMQLGMLIGGQADPTLDPGFMAEMQMIHVNRAQAGGKPPGGSPGNVSQEATAGQRLATSNL